jgi:hypothetical protein
MKVESKLTHCRPFGTARLPVLSGSANDSQRSREPAWKPPGQSPQMNCDRIRTKIGSHISPASAAHLRCAWTTGADWSEWKWLDNLHW